MNKLSRYAIATIVALVCIGIGITLPILFDLDGFLKTFIELFFLIAAIGFWRPIAGGDIKVGRKKQ